MFGTLLIIIGIVVLYKLIFDFIIPVYRASRDIKARFREMHQQMNDNVNQYEQQSTTQQKQQPKKTVDKTYIDFEEIK
jgi:hypothetical protein